MPGALFAAEALDATAATDSVLAEPWLLTPMKAPADKTAAAVADTSRAIVTINGNYSDKPAKTTMPNSYDPREARRPGLESGSPRLRITPYEIARLAVLLAAPFVIRPPDILQRAADGVSWRVASIEPMAGGTLLLSLNVLG